MISQCYFHLHSFGSNEVEHCFIFYLLFDFILLQIHMNGFLCVHILYLFFQRYMFIFCIDLYVLFIQSNLCFVLANIFFSGCSPFNLKWFFCTVVHNFYRVKFVLYSLIMLRKFLLQYMKLCGHDFENGGFPCQNINT